MNTHYSSVLFFRFFFSFPRLVHTCKIKSSSHSALSTLYKIRATLSPSKNWNSAVNKTYEYLFGRSYLVALFHDLSIGLIGGESDLDFSVNFCFKIIYNKWKNGNRNNRPIGLIIGTFVLRLSLTLSCYFFAEQRRMQWNKFIEPLWYSRPEHTSKNNLQAYETQSFRNKDN